MIYKALFAMVVSFSSLAQAQLVGVELVEQNAQTFLGLRTADRGRIYYDCDSLETKVENFLNQMGAKDVNIRCTGGLDRFGFTSLASISGTFKSLVQVGESGPIEFPYSRVQFKGFDDCALIAELLTVYKDDFITRNIKGRGSKVGFSCRSRDSHNVKLEVVK